MKAQAGVADARRACAAWLAVVRRHPRHVVLFAFAGGLLLAPLATVAPFAGILAAAAVSGRARLALPAAVAVLAGAALADARVQALGPGRLPALSGERIEARATVLEPLRRRRGGSVVARVRLERRGPAASVAGEQAVLRAVDGRIPPGVRVGSEVRLRGRVVPLGRSDAYQRRRGAHAAIVVDAWESTGAARGGLAGRLDAARERAARGLGAGIARPEAALLRGMVLGQDEGIAEDVREEFRRSGLAHLLAVSGQNVLLLCALVLALATVLDIPLRSRLLCAMLLVALYVPLAGGGPSIQRAGVMGVAGLVAALAGRPASRWYALGLAGAVTLALNPLAAGEPGWQLSFAAVAGLLALAPPLRSALVRARLPGPVAEGAAVTVAATLATTPLMALHFEQISLVSLPANLLAAAAVAPVMWLGMLGVAAAQVAPGWALPFTVVCAPLLGYLEWVAHAAAAVPHSAVPLGLPGPAWIVVGYGILGAAGLAVVRVARRFGPAGGPPQRVARSAAALAAVLAVGLAVVVRRDRMAPSPAPGELVISFLDVGQGDATLLQRDGAAVLFDTGPPGGPILRRLEEAGVERLDVLVLTHAEADHEGMALAVVERHRPRLLLDGGAGWPTAVQRGLPTAIARSGGRRLAAYAGQSLRVGALHFRLLWPPRPSASWRPEGDPNDRALVAHMRDGAFDLLLPADAESNVTAALDLPRVEALKVAHHGSADEGLPALLERLAPDFAAIEVGAENTYGHPTPSTLSALRGVDELVRTDRDGTVRLRVRMGRMSVERTGG